MYYLIGVSLLLTFLLAINLVSSLVTTLVWRVLAHRADEMRPGTRAALIFTLRAAPIAAGLIFVLGFVIPAFLLYEPAESGETVGFKQLTVLCLCLIGLSAATFRVFASWWRTGRLVADWIARSEPINVDGINVPAFRLRHKFPVFAVVGVFHPRLFVAEQVLSVLDGGEVAAVIQHELGHLDAFDNLRRLTMQLCGDLLIVPIGRSLDRGWTAASEVAADEFAVRSGGRASALSLASALIKIARLIPNGAVPAMPAAAFAVQSDGELLSTRIRRLVAISEAGTVLDDRSFSGPRKLAFWVLAAISVLGPLALDTYFLAEVHDISEALLAALR